MQVGDRVRNKYAHEVAGRVARVFATGGLHIEAADGHVFWESVRNVEPAPCASATPEESK